MLRVFPTLDNLFSNNICISHKRCEQAVNLVLEAEVRKYTVKIFFNDGSNLSVDCDDFRVISESHYEAIRDDLRIMTMPFNSVKYTVTIMNEN